MKAKKVSKKKVAKGATKRKNPMPIGRWVAYTIKVLMVGVVVTGVGVGIKALTSLDWQLMPVTQFLVEDELIYQDVQQIDETLAKFLSHSLLLLNVDEVRKEVELLPWVYKATVQKKWPGIIEIKVVEHEPIALWNEEYVLNSDGLPLQKPEESGDLVQLNGPQKSAQHVMKQYLQFTQIFEPMGMQLEEVTMFPRGSWSIKLSNGILISLGDKNVIERSRRVVMLLNLDIYKDVDIEYIDARYTNGIALRVAS